MKVIEVTARLLDSRERPLEQFAVSLQMFATKTRKWGQIGRANTDGNGLAAFKIAAEALEIGGVAPLLRLVEPGGPGDRVLASGGMVQFNARADLLTVDFGEIERLDDSAFAVIATISGVTGDTMAGVPHKPGLSQGTVLHNLTVDPTLGTTLSGARLRPGTVGPGVSALPALTAELTTLRSAAAEKDALIARREQDLQAERAKSADTDAKLAEAVKAARLAETRIATLEAQPPVGTATVDPVMVAELSTLRSQSLEKDQLIQRKDQDLAQRTAELAAARKDADQTKLTLIETTRAHGAALDRITELEAATAKGEVKSADIQSVFTQIGTKMGDANTVLKAQSTPFRLNTIKIDLRGPLTEDGQILLGDAAVQNGSGVSVELQADQPRDASETQVRVPDLSGLTESAVRRILRSVGLRLQTATQATLPDKATPGQAMTQHPAAGQSAVHGAEILVVFAALSGA